MLRGTFDPSQMQILNANQRYTTLTLSVNERLSQGINLFLICCCLRSCHVNKSKIQPTKSTCKDVGWLLPRLTWTVESLSYLIFNTCWTSDNLNMTLRTSPLGKTGLLPHTPSRCASRKCAGHYYHCHDHDFYRYYRNSIGIPTIVIAVFMLHCCGRGYIVAPDAKPVFITCAPLNTLD